MADGPDRERDRNPESGRYRTEYPDETFLDALETHAPAGTQEIAEVVGCHRNAAYFRLNDLENRGAVRKRKIGGTLIWELPE